MNNEPKFDEQEPKSPETLAPVAELCEADLAEVVGGAGWDPRNPLFQA